MTDRTVRLSPDDQALKRETRAAIDAAGGQSKAATYCRIGQQMLSDCGSPNVDRFLPLDAARDLDAVTRGAAGWPLVLGALARQLGFDLIERPATDATGAIPGSGEWHQRIAALTREHADVVGPLLAALGDGQLTAAEVRAGDLIRETDQVIQLWVTIRAMLECCS